MKQTKCCEKCFAGITELGVDGKPQCQYPDCPCHTSQTPEDWRERLKSRIVKTVALPVQYGGKSTTMTSETFSLEDLEDFIQSLLDENTKRVREEVLSLPCMKTSYFRDMKSTNQNELRDKIKEALNPNSN